MSYYGFKPYVPVAKRRAQAAAKVAKMKKKGESVSPVVIEGPDHRPHLLGQVVVREP